MFRLRKLVNQLRTRGDLSVEDQQSAWLVRIPKGKAFVCEVTIPFEVLEWFASVRCTEDEKEVWSDWMDYRGYDDSSDEKLEADMAEDIAAFVERVATSELHLPLSIWKEAEPSAAPNGGPVASVDNSNAPGGPPSVS
jgi:hypothetical protein